MASIPLPALSINPPQQQDTLGQFQKLMALRSLGQQQQLQQQQIQGATQENQMRALQLQDQQTLRESAKGLDWSKPDTFGKWISNAQEAGVSPQTLSSLALQRAQYQEQLAKTDTATLAAQKDANSQLQGHIDAIKGITDPTNRAAVASQQASQILSSGLVKDPGLIQKIQAMRQGQYVPTDDDLTMMENGLTDHNTQIEQRLKQSETAKNTTAQLLDQNKLDIIHSWEQNPQQVLGQVDQIVPPDGPNAALNARTKSQVQFALGTGDVDGAKAAIKAAAEQVGAVEKDVQVATNPAVRNAKIDDAVREQRQLTTGPATSNVPPHLAASATSDAAKADTDYAQSLSVNQRLAAMMDAAKKGNVVSYQLLPEEGALQVTTSQGVHRINMAEIQNYGGGSLWQEMQGHIGKALTGKSIPESVLNDMAEMQKIQAEGAQAKYQNTLQGINRRYGSSFEPVDMATGATSKQASQPGKTKASKYGVEIQ
jgi:hypothetical protein